MAMEKTENDYTENIIQRLSEKDVEIKTIPGILDILSGSVKTSNLFGAVLSDIHTGLMPEWQLHIKRLFDILISGTAMILFSPLLLYAAIRVKWDLLVPLFILRKEPAIKEKNSSSISSVQW